MFIRLSDAEVKRQKSPVQRPMRVSVEADTPSGSTVLLLVECLDRFGQVIREVFRNPDHQIVPTPVLKRIGLQVEVPPGNLSVPFIYAVIVEGNGWQHVYDAQTLFYAREKDAGDGVKTNGLQLMLPNVLREVDAFAPGRTQGQGEEEEEWNGPDEDESSQAMGDDDQAQNEGESAVNSPVEKPYLTLTPFPGALVSASSTQKPYIVDVDGGGFGDSRLEVTMDGEDAGGQPWSHTVEVRGRDDGYQPAREILPVSSWGTVGFQLELHASSDGHHAASLSGIAIEGDGRRFYIGAADLVGDANVPESMNLLRFSNSPATMLTLKHQLPDFFDFPSALTKLGDMFQRGELNPDWLQGQPLVFGLTLQHSEGEGEEAAHE